MYIKVPDRVYFLSWFPIVSCVMFRAYLARLRPSPRPVGLVFWNIFIYVYHDLRMCLLIKYYYCYACSLFLRFSWLGVSRGSPCDPGPLSAHSAQNVSLHNNFTWRTNAHVQWPGLLLSAHWSLMLWYNWYLGGI